MLNLKPVDLQMRVKKLVSEAILPCRAKDDDAGFDCVALDGGSWNNDRTYIEYKTGLSVQMPSGFHVELFPRSSISKYDLVLCNSIGLVDNGYRGEIVFRFKYVPRISKEHQPYQWYERDPETVKYVVCHRGAVKNEDLIVKKPLFEGMRLYNKGDKIGQIVVRKTYDFPVIEVSELSETERGTGGFGSTGA